MLNDALLSRSDATACDDRRCGDRVPFPSELILVWHHDLGTSVRYRVIDASDGGLRIRTTTPLVEGMTGMALKFLPDGRPIDRSIMVSWCRSSTDEQHDVGLRFF